MSARVSLSSQERTPKSCRCEDPPKPNPLRDRRSEGLRRRGSVPTKGSNVKDARSLGRASLGCQRGCWPRRRAFRTRQGPARSLQREELCWKGSVGGPWVYTHECRRAKKLIQVKWEPEVVYPLRHIRTSRLLKKAEKIKILCSWEPFSSFHRPMGLCVGSIFPFSWALDTRLPQRAPAGAARARFRIRIRL